jgi:hypothetical protein
VDIHCKLKRQLFVNLSMLVRIPVRIHLLKYLKAKVGADKLEIRHFNQMEMFADQSDIIFLQRQLSKTLYPFLNTEVQWEQSQLGNQGKYGIIGLNLKDYLINSRRIYISIQGVIKFNDCIDQIMLKEMIANIDKAISEKQRQDHTILEFMAKYQIDEDDIRFDSLKKRAYRERKRLAEKIFLDKNLKGSGAVLDLSFAERFIQS